MRKSEGEAGFPAHLSASVYEYSSCVANIKAVELAGLMFKVCFPAMPFGSLVTFASVSNAAGSVLPLFARSGAAAVGS